MLVQGHLRLWQVSRMASFFSFFSSFDYVLIRNEMESAENLVIIINLCCLRKRERKRDAMLYRNLLLIPVLILQYIYFFVGSDINELGFPSSSSHQLHLQGRQIQKQSLWLTFHVIHDLVDVVVLVKVRDDDRCVWYQFLWNVGWMLWRRKHQTPFSSLPGMQSLIVTDDIQGMMIIMTGVRDVLVHCIWWSRLLVVLNNMFMMYIYSFSWVKGTKPA